MIWGLPSALLLIAGALPLILFLHSLKPRGLKASTTALFIWERVLKERPLATRLGWLLRNNLLLILQLLAALLLISALADPALLNFGAPAGDTIVIMDLTASMKAKGATATRFDGARREFLSLVDALPAGKKMMLIGAGAETRLIVPFSADKKRLKEVGQSLTPGDTSGQVKEAILFAHGFLKKDSPDRVVVISDFAFAGAEEFSREAAHLRFIKIAGGATNTGIVGLAVRRHADGARRYEMLVHVRNFGAKRCAAPLTIAVGERLLARQQVELEAGGRQVLVYPYEGDLAGTLTARLEIDDDLITDNRAELSVSAAAPVRILYVGPGNPFLSGLLRFFPGAQLTALEHWHPDALGRKGGRQDGQDNLQGNRYDVLIFDRVAPPELSEGNIILINTVAPNLPLTIAGELRLPRVSTSLARHPLTAGLTLGDLHVQESLRVIAGGDSIVLARAARSRCWLCLRACQIASAFHWFRSHGFGLAVPRRWSRLLFHRSFPLFDLVSPRAPRLSRGVGQRRYAESRFVPPGARRWRSLARRNERNFRRRQQSIYLQETLETGVYTYKSAGREGRFTVNLFDEEESNISARVSAPAAPPPPAARERSVATARFSLSAFLILAALFILALELIMAWRMRLAFATVLFRACALAALALAWLNPKFFHATQARMPVAGVDLSRSVGQEGGAKARELLDLAGGLTNADVRTGLLTFGRAPEWEFPPRRGNCRAGFYRARRSRRNRYSGRIASGAGPDRRRTPRQVAFADGRQRESRQQRADHSAVALARHASLDLAGESCARPQRSFCSRSDLTAPGRRCSSFRSRRRHRKLERGARARQAFARR